MSAVAVFPGPDVKGYVEFHQRKAGVVVSTFFTKLPPGEHGFHIHKAGDLRGEGCKMACDHWHKGRPTRHGGSPSQGGQRHTGDLGNILMPSDGSPLKVEHMLRGIDIKELYGRSIIVHADPDDLGKGPFEDSHSTGHSGARIGCAIIGRVAESCTPAAKPKPTTEAAVPKANTKEGMVGGFDPNEANYATFGNSYTRKAKRGY